MFKMYNWASDEMGIQSEPLDLSIKSSSRDNENPCYFNSYKSEENFKEGLYSAGSNDRIDHGSNRLNFTYLAGAVDKLSSTFSNLSKSVGVSGKNVLPCHVCFKSFDRPSLLKRHLRTHTGEKPHVCPVCDKGFSTSSSLNTHKRIHTGEKPHRCPECGKCFTASSNLYYHRMTHTKNKPHKCTLCPRSFPTPGELRAHRPAHGGAWPHACPLCARGFAKHANLRHHMRLHGAGSMLPFYPMESAGITSVLKSLRMLKEGAHTEDRNAEDDQDTFHKDIGSKSYFRPY